MSNQYPQIQSDLGVSRPTVRAAFQGTEDLNTQGAKDMLSLSKDLKLPEQTVRHDLKYARNEAILRKVEEDYGLSIWASKRPENAVFMRENSDTILETAKNIDNVDNNLPEEDYGFFDKIGMAYDRGDMVIKLGELGNQFSNATTDEEKNLIRNQILELNKQRQHLQENSSLSLGLDLAIEQIPLFIGSIDDRLSGIAKTTPYSMLTGMTAGGLAGSVVPGAGTVGGMISGGIRGLGVGAYAGNIVGSAEHSYNLERGVFIADLANDKDLNDQYIPQEVLGAAGSIYGGAASLIEVGSEAVFLKVLDITGLPKRFTKGRLKEELRSAVKRAMTDKSLQPILMDFGKTIGTGALLGGAEELTQQFFSNVTELFMKDYVADEYNTAFDDVDISEGLAESLYTGAVAGAWFSSAGASLKTGLDVRDYKNQKKFTDRNIIIHENIENLRNTMPSDVVETYIDTRHNELNQDVYLPADAVLELYQSGNDIISPLDIDLVELNQAAELGQDVAVKLSKAHAQLDTEQFKTFSEIMKMEDGGVNSFDLANYDYKVEEDTIRIAEMMEEYQFEESNIEYEIDVFKQNLKETISYNPYLMNQINKNNSDVNAYVEEQAEFLLRGARRLRERSGNAFSVADFISKIKTGSELKNLSEQDQTDRANFDADQQVFNLIWGRLNKESIKSVMGKDIAAEIEYAYGRGIFDSYANRAPSNKVLEQKLKDGEITIDDIKADEEARRKRQGLSFDGLAEELANLNLIDTIEDNPTDALYKLLMSENMYTKENRGKRRRFELQDKAQKARLEQVERLNQEPLLAPNGKPSNLSPELYATVRTAEFKDWFGDFENDPANASKVVDENGEPLVVYHGTNAELDSFSIEEIGSVTGSSYGKGFYFTSDRNNAENYSQEKIIISSFLNIKNPAILSDNTRRTILENDIQNFVYSFFEKNKEIEISKEEINKIIETANKENADYYILDEILVGILSKVSKNDKTLVYQKIREEQKKQLSFDGFIKKTENPVYDEYVAYSPNQIKSIENRGTFSPESDNIYFQGGVSKFNKGISLVQDEIDKYKNENLDFDISLSLFESKQEQEYFANKKIEKIGIDLVKELELFIKKDFNNIDVMNDEFDKSFRDNFYPYLLSSEIFENNSIAETRTEVKTIIDDIRNNKYDLGEIKTEFTEELVQETRNKFSQMSKNLLIPFLESFGLVVDFKQSGKSDSMYFYVKDYDNNISETIRYSDHKLPEIYDGTDYNVYFDNDINKTLENFGNAINKIYEENDLHLDVFDSDNIYFQFLGEQGARNLDQAEESTIRLDNLDIARQMEEQGKDALSVKMATGWERGADNKWRYEVAEGTVKKIKLKEKIIDSEIYYTAKLGDIYNSPALEAYPELKDLDIIFQETQEETRGSFQGNSIVLDINFTRITSNKNTARIKEIENTPEYIAYQESLDDTDNIQDPIQSEREYNNIEIEWGKTEIGKEYNQLLNTNKLTVDEIGYSQEKMKSTLEHEIQHAIQDIEGFARGGNVEEFQFKKNDIVDTIVGVDNNLQLFLNDIDFSSFADNSMKEVIAKNKTVEQHFADLEKYKQESKYAKEIKANEESLKELRKKYNIYAKPQKLYNSLQGEVEARNTQARLGMTEEQRRNTLAISTEDVAREDQIFLEQGKRYVAESREIETNQPFGSIRKLEDGTYIIDLFEKANLSTVTHELSHFFFLEMQDLMRSGLADESLVKDMQTLKDWLGMEAFEDFTIANTKGDTEGAKILRLQSLQEKLAQSMEQYLLEGKAPTANLRRAFRRISNYMKAIYKRFVSNNTMNIPEEVRNVFDRMLASEQEIQVEASRAGILPFGRTELENLGLIGKAKEFVQKLGENITTEAEEALDSAKAKARKTAENRIKNEVKEQVNAMRVYKALAEMRKNKVNRAKVDFIMGIEFSDMLGSKYPATFSKDKGRSPQEIAAEFDYNSTEEFLLDVYNAKNKNLLIEELINERQLGEDAQHSAEDALFEAKALGVHETEIAIKLNEKLGKDKNKTASKKSIDIIAFSTLAKMSMKEALNTYKFIVAARTNYNKERAAILAGNLELALDYNTKARINLQLIQESKKLNADFEKLNKNAKEFVDNKNADPRARYFINQIAFRMNLQRLNKRLADVRDLSAITEWADFVGMEITPSLLGAVKNYKDISFEKFATYMDEVSTIIHMELELRKIIKGNQKIEKEKVVNEITSSIYENNKVKEINEVSEENELLSTIKRTFTSLLKADTIAKEADGFKFSGAFWRHTVDLINMANADFNKRLVKLQRDLLKLYSVYSKKELKKIKGEKKIIPEFSTTQALTKEQMIAIALNVGNEDNLLRLRRGYPRTGKGENGLLTDEQIQAVLDELTQKDWDFVQSVWDYFDTYAEDSFKQEELIKGLAPTKVEPRQVFTKFGYYKGGYYPIVYDNSKSALAPKDLDPSENKNVFNMASVAHGNMKERSKTGLKNVPLKLSLDLIPEKLTDTVFNLAFRIPVREVNRILRDKQVSQAFTETLGKNKYQELQDWLVDVAGGKPATNNGFENTARWARTATSFYYMGLKINTALQQLSGVFNSITEIGIGNTLTGIATTLWNMPRMGKFMHEVNNRSDMMAYRVKNIDREVADLSNELLAKGGILNWSKKVAFKPMGYVQYFTVDMPIWWGAFQKGLKDFNGDEIKAAKYADNIVEVTQGAGFKKDLARIQRGSEFQKLFTMFYTYFSAFYQMAYTRGIRVKKNPSPKTIIAAANFVLVNWILANTVNEILAGRGPEEDEENFDWFVKTNLLFPANGVPLLRDFMNPFVSDFGYQVTPASTAPEALIKIAQLSIDLFTGDKDLSDKKELSLTAIKAIGFATRSPLFGSQVVNTAREVMDFLDGTDPEFEAWRIIRGLRNED